MSPSVFATGFSIGLSLILAIGAQNAFVLRQGLRGEHVFWICLVCSLSDAALIALGVSSFQTIAAISPMIDPIMRVAGAAFLIWYGARSVMSAMRSSEALVVAAGAQSTLNTAIATALALTWLNPHVYLDTVILLGTISTQYPGQHLAFALGAMAASFIFFFSLGYGAAWLRPIFARPQAWRLLEGAIALTMWIIAARLLLGM
jgi:L-lysine exporter family protein LysE/ArgO